MKALWSYCLQEAQVPSKRDGVWQISTARPCLPHLSHTWTRPGGRPEGGTPVDTIHHIAADVKVASRYRSLPLWLWGVIRVGRVVLWYPGPFPLPCARPHCYCCCCCCCGCGCGCCGIHCQQIPPCRDVNAHDPMALSGQIYYLRRGHAAQVPSSPTTPPLFFQCCDWQRNRAHSAQMFGAQFSILQNSTHLLCVVLVLGGEGVAEGGSSQLPLARTTDYYGVFFRTSYEFKHICSESVRPFVDTTGSTVCRSVSLGFSSYTPS